MASWSGRACALVLLVSLLQHKGIMSQINAATGIVETRLKVQHYADSLTNKEEYPVRAVARAERGGAGADQGGWDGSGETSIAVLAIPWFAFYHTQPCCVL